MNLSKWNVSKSSSGACSFKQSSADLLSDWNEQKTHSMDLLRGKWKKNIIFLCSGVVWCRKIVLRVRPIFSEIAESLHKRTQWKRKLALRMPYRKWRKKNLSLRTNENTENHLVLLGVALFRASWEADVHHFDPAPASGSGKFTLSSLLNWYFIQYEIVSKVFIKRFHTVTIMGRGEIERKQKKIRLVWSLTSALLSEPSASSVQ